MTEYIGNVRMDLTYYTGFDDYSDGDVEDEILRIVKEKDATEYNAVIKESKDWAIMYHLSELRQNIIESVPIQKSDSVLEIGSGCGAVTGALADKARKVTCVELSKKRSMINAYRNKDKENIEIKVGNFETVEAHLEEKYDVITLIGVFEYAQSYINSPNPFEDFLKMIEGHLSEQGMIAVAIENKYGLKYWAGCREDHVRTFFAGLEGYPGTNRARTFSKGKLEELFLNIGMEKVKFYYPYPDYKFATSVYSDEHLPKKGELTNNIRNFDNDRMYLFDEGLVYDNLIEDHMFPFFSNSYLVIAGREG